MSSFESQPPPPPKTKNYKSSLEPFTKQELEDIHYLKCVDRPILSLPFIINIGQDGDDVPLLSPSPVSPCLPLSSEEEDGGGGEEEIDEYHQPNWHVYNLGASKLTDEPSSKWLALKTRLGLPVKECSLSPIVIDGGKLVNSKGFGGGTTPPFFETDNLPCTITNCTTSWNKETWNTSNFFKEYDDYSFRFSDTHGELLDIVAYEKYCINLAKYDDSPLAIYDSEFGDHERTNSMLNDYSVPLIFSDDIFSYYKGDSKPPYRWILLGPERSGTGLHIDPLFTNAWVTLMEGRKRWLLFPPSTPPKLLRIVEGIPSLSSSCWFDKYYDLVTSELWPEEYKPYEVLQYPGETVFVPMGWMHLVLNLDPSFAVTHNYACEHYGLLKIWRDVCKHEEKFALRWWRAMRFENEKLALKIWEYHVNGKGGGGDDDICIESVGEEEGWRSNVTLDKWDEKVENGEEKNSEDEQEMAEESAVLEEEIGNVKIK